MQVSVTLEQSGSCQTCVCLSVCLLSAHPWPITLENYELTAALHGERLHEIRTPYMTRADGLNVKMEGAFRNDIEHCSDDSGDQDGSSFHESTTDGMAFYPVSARCSRSLLPSGD